jgi:hypothetical protein
VENIQGGSVATSRAATRGCRSRRCARSAISARARLGEGEPADLLLRPNVVEQDVVPFDRLHRSAGCLLYLGTKLTGLCVTELPGCLALPERHAESLPSFAVAENDVTDIPGLAAYPWMDDVAHDSPHISDSVGCRLQDVHSRKHRDLQLAVVFPYGAAAGIILARPHPVSSACRGGAEQDLVVKRDLSDEGKSRATVSRGLGGSRHPGREEANRPASRWLKQPRRAAGAYSTPRALAEAKPSRERDLEDLKGSAPG